MSKNFELLQQIGNDEELFRTNAQPGDAVPAADAEASPELDKETVERVLWTASLPSVFESANEPVRQTPSPRSELSFDLDVAGVPEVLDGGASADAFRSSRNLASPIGEQPKHAENRVPPVARDCGSLPKTTPADRKPEATPVPPSQERELHTKRKVQGRVSRKVSFSFPWLDLIKAGAKGWAGKARARNDHHAEDLEGITRAEEIKLVQRVFPGTDQGSPRVVVFAGLEGEAGCAPTCARVAEILAARAEGPVCVVDANFRTPSLHKYFGVGNVKGLAEATVEAGPIQNFAQQIPEPDLWLMPSGAAAAQLSFPAMADGLRVRLEELREAFRYVVIHSGPIRLETSATLLSRWTDGVVLVVEANATRRNTARRVKEILVTANVSVLGVVLYNRTFPIPEAIYRRV
jgi:Mrp family chromosome partitioning ATPase